MFNHPGQSMPEESLSMRFALMDVKNVDEKVKTTSGRGNMI